MPCRKLGALTALNTDEGKMKHNGKERSVEIGTVLWVRVYDMKLEEG